MGRIRKWDELYQLWKESHPTTKERRREIVRGCIGKLAWPNFLEALKAVVRLTSDRGGRNAIYMCDICHKHHIGRMGSNPQFPKELQ